MKLGPSARPTVSQCSGWGTSLLEASENGVRREQAAGHRLPGNPGNHQRKAHVGEELQVGEEPRHPPGGRE